MVHWRIREILDVSEEFWRGSKGLGGPSGRSGTGQGTLGEFQNGPLDPRRGPGRVMDP